MVSCTSGLDSTRKRCPSGAGLYLHQLFGEFIFHIPCSNKGCGSPGVNDPLTPALTETAIIRELCADDPRVR